MRRFLIRAAPEAYGSVVLLPKRDEYVDAAINIASRINTHVPKAGAGTAEVAPERVTVNDTEAVRVPVVGLETVVVGLLPMSLPVPVHTTVPPAGTIADAQFVPGIVTVSPGVPPVQVIVTCCEADAGFGFAVQVGRTGPFMAKT